MKHLLCLFLVFYTSLNDEVELEPTAREPRFLMVTTVTSLSTLTSHFNCWVNTNTAVGAYACKKKKRSLFGKATEDVISPSPAIQDKLPEEIDLDASSNVEKVEDSRNGRFLNYFMTITNTFTVTSYSATSSLASLYCTPPGWTMAKCPGTNGK